MGIYQVYPIIISLLDLEMVYQKITVLGFAK